MELGLEHTYARGLPGTFSPARPAGFANPRLLFWNDSLCGELGLPLEDAAPETLAAIFCGNALPRDAEPIAQAYAGHQFGNFSRQLGDGRALLVGEILDPSGRRFDIALKGSGRTVWSRGGDGLAAVGPMLREVVLGEAMKALGIPTTRALAVVATGEEIRRETPLPGAVLARVAASHIRVGTFEYFASRGDLEHLMALAEYAIARHDPALSGTPARYASFLRAVASRQASLVASWMHAGFIHGVMNTDNVAVSGETIDYGPCAFLEAFDSGTVFSSIDHAGRYAYGNQPRIAHWNLARLCEAFLPLLGSGREAAIATATEIVDEFPALLSDRLLEGWLRKLGIQGGVVDETRDTALVQDWLGLLQAGRVDFTLSWRHLAQAADGDESALRAAMPGVDGLAVWLAAWRERCEVDDGVLGRDPAASDAEPRRSRMDAVNPLYIPRNHLVEEALAAASDRDDLRPLRELLAVLRDPFVAVPGRERFAEPAPAEATACYRTFCGT